MQIIRIYNYFMLLCDSLYLGMWYWHGNFGAMAMHWRGFWKYLADFVYYYGMNIGTYNNVIDIKSALPVN